MQNFGRPERHDDVRLGGLSTDPRTFSQRLTQVRPLRIEAAGRILEVGESRAILQVKERGAMRLPGDHVGPAGEVVMLVGLVDPNSIAKRPHVCRLELTHERVHRIGRPHRSSRAPPGIDELEIQTQPKRAGNTDGTLHRRWFSSLDQVYKRAR